MALVLALVPVSLIPHLHLGAPNPKTGTLSLLRRMIKIPTKIRHGFLLYAAATSASDGSQLNPNPGISISAPLSETLVRHSVLLVHLAAFLIISGARSRAHASVVVAPSAAVAASDQTESSATILEKASGDEELMAQLEAWKSKTYALTVPLRIVALRGSLPPSWIKTRGLPELSPLFSIVMEDFIQVQSRRLNLNVEYRGGFETIFADLSSASDGDNLQPKSAMASDIISLGDSWLSYAIIKGLIEPIKHVEEQDWYKNLNNKWKILLCRNGKGELDPNGYTWGAPYRWGTMVIAYKKTKFKKHNLRPIQDWGDLWRAELAGKISMIDSPREVIGGVLKYMGASYNTKDIHNQVAGGREEVLRNLRLLQKQVRLFDSANYLKAFSVGDVWAAVGWSSDVIPVAKRMSNVAVVVPKSGTSLWADLWVIPQATKFNTERIGGRVRSPSPLIYQWMEFCLQISRSMPFQQEIIPGASPFAIEDFPQGPRESLKGKPKLDTNLVDGVPPPDILAKCEFLEPLSEKALEDHEWLISSMHKSGFKLI